MFDNGANVQGYDLGMREERGRMKDEGKPTRMLVNKVRRPIGNGEKHEQDTTKTRNLDGNQKTTKKDSQGTGQDSLRTGRG